MPLLADDAALQVRGHELRVNQAMVRTGKPASPGVKAGAALALCGLAWLGGRVLAKGAVATLALVLAIMRVKRVSQWCVSLFLPAAMRSMDKAMRKIKEATLIPIIQGRVLDFGCGDGQYLRYVGKALDQVTEIVSLEPNTNLHRGILAHAEKFNCTSKPYQLSGEFAEDLLLERGPETFDTIIVGNVLCEVPDQRAALSSLYKLLAPGGCLWFIEHVAAEKNTIEYKVQHMLNPLWCTLTDGCNINRSTLKRIEEQPWEVNAWDLSFRGGILGRIQVGLATKPDAKLSAL